MRNIALLITALDIIEERLREPMNAADLARLCFSSYSGLQKLFGYVFRCSINEYITKRRITCASRELLASEKGVTEIALEFQYGSPEAFSRAFKRFWGIPPSEFRKTRRFPELFPRFRAEIDNGGIIMRERKPVDISELYDELKKLTGSYVLCIDLIHFHELNLKYGYAAGDLVIAEAFARLEREIGENMLLFRIGGDEFAVVTRYFSQEEAVSLAERITARNGEAVKTTEHEVPLSLRVGISRLPDKALNYHNTLEIMYSSIEKARGEDGDIAVLTE